MTSNDMLGLWFCMIPVICITAIIITFIICTFKKEWK